MKSRSSITEFVSVGLVIAAAVIGCGSDTQGDKTDGLSTGGRGGSGGASVTATVTGSGGAAGSTVPMGTGGAMGTGGVSAGTGGGVSAGAGGVPANTADAGDAAVSQEAGASDAGGPMPGSDAGSTPCTGGTLRPGQSTVTIQHAGASRNYILHVPPGYTGKTRVPL